MEITIEASGRLRISHHAIIGGKRLRKTKLLPAGVQDMDLAMRMGQSLFGENRPALEERIIELQSFAPDIGSIYFAKNAGLPGVVKIGLSRTNVHDRMRNLSTAQPKPWSLVGHALVRHVGQLEQILHVEFAAARVALNREFFALDEDSALAALDLCRAHDGVDIAAAMLKIR